MSNAEAVQDGNPVKNGDLRAFPEVLDIRARSHWEGSLWLDISAHRPILHMYIQGTYCLAFGRVLVVEPKYVACVANQNFQSSRTGPLLKFYFAYGPNLC